MAKTIIIPQQSIETVYRRGIYQRTILIEYQEDVPDTLTITFQGKEYVCSNYSSADASHKAYGANTDVAAEETVDWSQYPFHLSFYHPEGGGYEVTLITESAGTYTVEVYTGGDAPKPTPKPSIVKVLPSIEESLLKIADKVDPDNKVEVSPNNLNPNYSIQRSLERIADSDLSGGGGAGYTVETKAVAVVPEQSVTTEVGENTLAFGRINIAEGITSFDDVPDTLTITFQGQEYVCEAVTIEGGKVYGGVTETGPDFSQYPFVVTIGGNMGNQLVTESAGTYTVKATGEQKTVTPSKEFKTAVSSVVAESENLKVLLWRSQINAIALLNSPDLSAEEIYSLIRRTLQSNSGLIEAYIKDSATSTADEFRATQIRAESGKANVIKFCFLYVADAPSGTQFRHEVFTLSEAGTVSYTVTSYTLTTA